MPELSIGRAFAWLADQSPDAVAVRCGDEVLTRRELDLASNRIARRWAREGLAVDDSVTIALPNGIDVVLATVAAWKAGATPAPLSLATSADERAEIEALIRPALVVDGPLDPCAEEDDGPLPDRWASSWKAASSSGSTGRPKVVRATAPARVDPSRPAAAFVPQHAVQLVAAPLVQGATFVYAFRGLMTGHELVVMPVFDAGEWLRLVTGATWAVLSPATMARVLERPERPEVDLTLLHVGARCPEPVKRAWIERLGPDRVHEVYAGTESQGVAFIDGTEWLAHPGSVGRGVGGSEFLVFRPDGSICDAGEVGEIRMRRGSASYSYVGAEPDVRDGWHTLGDAGWLDEDGYLYVGDRLADLVTVDGTLVLPADVEAVLEAHPRVRGALVVERAGLHAVVDGDLTEAELAAWAAGHLDAVRRPRSWQLVVGPLRDDAGKARRSDHR
jgi:bile acid-coenzyme A ligase